MRVHAINLKISIIAVNHGCGSATFTAIGAGYCSDRIRATAIAVHGNLPPGICRRAVTGDYLIAYYVAAIVYGTALTSVQKFVTSRNG